MEHALLAQRPAPGDRAHAAQQRLLAYILRRQGNMLRQLGRGEEALVPATTEAAAGFADRAGEP